jgi:hypothetical protein
MRDFTFISGAVTASTSANQFDVPLPVEAPKFQRIRQVVISAASSANIAREVQEVAVGSTANLAPGRAMLKSTVAGLYSNNVLWLGDAVASDSLITVLGDEYGTAQQPTGAYAAIVR